MADPATWLMAASAVSAGTSLMSGIQANAQAGAEADQAEANARTTGQQTAAAEDLQRRRNRQILARQRAAIAESGIGFGGSSETLQRDSAVQAELDALNIRYEGRIRGLGLRTDARFARARGKNALYGSAISAAGQLLGGVYGPYAANKLANTNAMFDQVAKTGLDPVKLRRVAGSSGGGPFSRGF